MRLIQQIDPLILASAAVSFFLAITRDPWWIVTGAGNSNLLTVKVSPYYFQTIATGISPAAPFVASLGSMTNVLLIIGSVAMAAAGIRSKAWWRELAVYFSLCAFSELYLSFLLMYHAAETTLLATYGIIPPYSGTSHLSSVIIGLDLNSYPNPLVTARLNLPFFLGLLSLGLLAAGLLFKKFRDRGKSRGPQGVGAIFTPE
jgi:hypothetical protein